MGTHLHFHIVGSHHRLFQGQTQTSPCLSYKHTAYLWFFIICYKPPQYKLEPRLARLMGIHTQTRPVIVNAIWQYIKVRKLKKIIHGATQTMHEAVSLC